MQRWLKPLGRFVPFILVVESAVLLSLAAVALIGWLAVQSGVPDMRTTLDNHGMSTLINIAMIMLIWSVSTYGAACIWQHEEIV
tara:strand:+ start:270 stop:521 length:252 start_codon:yes stop_codon:yes gene_type:complete